MLTPIQCVSCGYPIGDISAMFRAERAERLRAELAIRGTAVSQAAIDPGLQNNCEDVLAKLGITRECCRMHVVTAMHFNDYNQ